MKTHNEILTAVYNLVKTTSINNLSGEIYKNTRPTDSKLDDCVISVKMGVSGKIIQDGLLTVSLFYLDILQGNSFTEDTLKSHSMELLLQSLSALLLKMNGYAFYPDTREIHVNAIPEIRQHYAILKINFKLV